MYSLAAVHCVWSSGCLIRDVARMARIARMARGNHTAICYSMVAKL